MRLSALALMASFFLFQINSPSFFGKNGPHAPFAADSLECAAMDLQKQLFAANPERQQLHQALENQAYQFLRQKQNPGQESAVMADYTFPLVFHIIHQNGPENISDVQILTALDHLNDAFANINFYDENNGVDTKIEFCLAKRDPNGNATTGINRVMSPLTNVDFSTDIALKNLIRWNPLEYINIWLVRSINGGGVAGYAYFPSSHGGLEDGIVMLGSIMPNLGGGHSTLVHEIGHYLGLYHTFEEGCNNNDCLLDGDRVCDTPPDNTTVSPGNCSGIVNSCTTDAQSGFPSDQDDINWNYVDYGNQPCRNGYTQGQADRMSFFIENVRQSLLNSPACQEACLSPIVAGFTASAMMVNIGSTVNFTNTSTGGTNYIWAANGTPFAATLNASYTFNTLGLFEITLDVANSDPNCSGTATATVEVVCPISASFSTSNLYPAPGETVSFSNASIGASNYTWSLNGTNVSTAANFSNTFSSPGQYNICLTAGNGLCSEQFCQLVFVIEELGDGDCESSFVRRLGENGVNEESFYLIPDGNGNYFIGGRIGNNSAILQIDPSGNIIAQRSYNFTSGSDFVATLMVDNDGYLVGSARDQVNSNTVNVLFKINWQTGNFIWARQLANPAYNRFDRVFQHPVDGNYMFCGMTTGAIDNYIIKVDKNTGAVTWQFVSDYGENGDVYSGFFTNGNAIYYAGQGRLGAGLDDIRPTLTKFDLNGNMQWARIHLRSPNQPSRLYNMDLFIENDTIINCGRGSLTSDNLTNSRLLFYKTNINGGLIWAKSYTVAGGTEVAGYRAHPIPGGYIVQGTFNEGGSNARLFVARLNKSGNVVWAKKINTATAAGGITRPLTLIDGGFIVFAAQTNQYDTGQNNDLLFGKISLDGQVVGAGCILIEDINLVENAISNPYDGMQIPAIFTANYPYPNSSQSSLPADLPINDIPGCECIEFNLDCQSTFINTYGYLGVQEVLYSMLPEMGGNFLVGGEKNDSLFLGLITPGGNFIWQRTLKIGPSAGTLKQRLLFMTLDSDNNIIGIVDSDPIPPALAFKRRIVFKYNYLGDQLLWANLASFSGSTLTQPNANMILEKAPGGNYLCLGKIDNVPGPPLNEENAILYEIDRNTGALVWEKTYTSRDEFSRAFIHQGEIFIAGQFDQGTSGTVRSSLSRFDFSGNEIWSRIYLKPFSETAYLTGMDILIKDDAIYNLVFGNLGQATNNGGSIKLIKTDLSGNIEWAKNYEILGTNLTDAERLIALPDGILIAGYSIDVNNIVTPFLMKIDSEGHSHWTKNLPIPDGLTAIHDIVLYNDKIYFNGVTYDISTAEYDFLFAKLTSDGILDSSCSVLLDTTVIETDIQDLFDGLTPLDSFNSGITLTDLTGSSSLTTSILTTLCSFNCADTCANGLPIHTMPDALMQGISGQCTGDSIIVTWEVCNADSVALPAGTPVSFYQNNPTATTANLLATIILPSAVAPGSCEMFNTELALPINQQIFVVVNDNGATPTPFDLFSDFPNNSINECDYTNNIANFEVIFTAPLLDLGPDISACHFEVVELDAGPGFATYQWSAPGNNGQTFTAWEPGTYSVTVTDDCGGTQSDEITISVLPTTIVEIGVDTALICAGGSISFAASSFAGYQWFPAGLVNCDTCAAITATSTVDTCLTLLAATTDGCYSTDTVCLQIIPSILTTDTVNFCQGDTVTIFGNLVTQPGDYVETFTTPDGCDSTHSIVLTVFDTVSTSETISICENGSADIFGTPISMPGIYSQTFQTFNGCDSTHTISLLVADTIYASQMIAICAGDSALIFGNWETLPGTFSQVLSSTSGCDSISVIELAVNDTYQTAESVTICSNETADIFGIPTNIAGDYSQTLQSVAGCDSTHTITLIVFDTASIGEVINICENEMADVFGTPTNVPGIYAQTFQNLNGCDSTYTIQLLVNDTLMVAESINICEGDSALIFGNWEKQAGMFMQVFSTATGCDSTVAVELTVFPVATTNETIAICENQTANVFGTPTNVAGVYTQTFQTTTGCDSTHTIELTVLDTVMTNETIVICENETADIFGMPTNVAGTYSQSSLMANGCDSLHTILLLVNDTVQTSESVSICFGDSAFIFGNWETLPGNYSQVSQTTNGCDSTHTVTLAVGSQISLSLQSQSSCAGQMDGSVEATIAGGNPPYTYQWNVPGQTGSTLSGLPPGPYAVTVIDANGCSSTGSTVVVSQADLEVQLDIVDVSCFGFADGSLNVIAQPPGLYYYSLDGIDYQASTDWSNTNMPPGNYTLYVYNVIGCLWEFPFTIHEPPPVFVSLPPDVTIELGETITLNATTGQDSLLFSWYPDLWLSCDDCPRPAANPEATTLYTVMVFDQNDCSASDSILVMVEFTPGIYVPNAFSPNGDGINDLFYIQGKGISEVRLLRVFDRWGEMVFESSNFLPNDPLFGWDGTFKGKKMNPAVFAYYAELNMLDGTNRAVKGDVTLLR